VISASPLNQYDLNSSERFRWGSTASSEEVSLHPERKTRRIIPEKSR
jgi:hypothetical protein